MSVEVLGWSVRTHVYRALAETGLVPTKAEIGAALGVGVFEVGRLLRQLADAHVLALDVDSGEVWMAHPFSGVPTSMVVAAGGRNYYANCAWDAIALPMLLEVDGGGDLVCPATGEVIAFRVEQGVLLPTSAVIRFPVPARHFWVDIGYT